ncbi:LacI family DNA-binding transcriptional regulator [Roseicella aquatilis]|uniref:LacI family DNA-binding transcriptional regulator n=1 Tax=Roseicella aquatilis TaxID=2527868 RepID=A0A4R4DB44_9PROT|nr:LacI family DNA-binding transcriptional regulator [Roseicella aquatilis]TCZ56637.1 LacI family DNA-binding transcriptional regulator [Roseicella aquatilis]
MARDQRSTEAGRSGGGVTLAEVAAAAGVGESTVSRVLRRHGSYSGRTRDRVIEAVERLGYVPNRIAGTLASTASRLVAMVIPSVTNIVFTDVLNGIGGPLEERGYQAVFAVTDYDPRREESLVAAMLAWRPAAVILAGLEHTEATRRMLGAQACRVVELLDTDGPAIDLAIGISNRAAGRAGAGYLLGRGYRRIGYLGHDPFRDRRAGKRLEGFRAALAEAGRPPAAEMVLEGASSVARGREGLARLLAGAPGLDAVYFSNDDMAVGGWFHCLEAGIAVPGRLALFGHNGLDIGAALPQPLATLRTPRDAMGREAARLVLEDAPAQVLDLGFELIPGATA